MTVHVLDVLDNVPNYLGQKVSVEGNLVMRFGRGEGYVRNMMWYLTPLNDAGDDARKILIDRTDEVANKWMSFPPSYSNMQKLMTVPAIIDGIVASTLISGFSISIENITSLKLFYENFTYYASKDELDLRQMVDDTVVNVSDVIDHLNLYHNKPIVILGDMIGMVSGLGREILDFYFYLVERDEPDWKTSRRLYIDADNVLMNYIKKSGNQLMGGDASYFSIAVVAGQIDSRPDDNNKIYLKNVTRLITQPTKTEIYDWTI